ncbi:hypothetical protein HPMBJEAJ_00005 [Aeromonas phage avDM6]|nr:hypothetical protein HPMBJEAJ_00005 [Aeromonas phage avDM6]
MLKLYRFYWDAGRNGSVEGIFVEDSEVVEKYIGSYVYFGEILGKHSEVDGTLDREDLEIVTDDQEKIQWLVSLMGYSISGYNPISYIREDDESDEEE